MQLKKLYKKHNNKKKKIQLIRRTSDSFEWICKKHKKIVIISQWKF